MLRQDAAKLSIKHFDELLVRDFRANEFKLLADRYDQEQKYNDVRGKILTSYHNRKGRIIMPSLATYNITPPTDPFEFEKICMDFLADKYNADTSLYGRKGQAQHGIDVIVTLRDHSNIFAQCKDVKSASTSDLEKWIVKAEECELPMKKFLLLGSFERDATLQGYICSVSNKRISEGKVPVQLFFGDDIIHYIKNNPSMLRLYYPEFYQGEIIKLMEASQKPEEKFPTMICGVDRLRHLFFEEAVKYRVEEFLNCNPKDGMEYELVGSVDAFLFSARKLLYRAPLLKETDYFEDIQHFIHSLNKYCDFFPNVTELAGKNRLIVRNKFHSQEEEDDINKNERLRRNAIEEYSDLQCY